MGRTLGWSFLIFSFLVGITVCDKDKNSHSMAVSVNNAELSQSDTAQSGKAKGSSTFEEPLITACSFQGTEVKECLLGMSTTNVITRNNISSSASPVNMEWDIMKVGPYELNNMEELTLPVEDDACECDKYRYHACIHLGSEMGVYRIDTYIGPLGLEAMALHSPDYVYHPISLALPHSGSIQDDVLTLQIRPGDELVAQEFLPASLQFECLNFNKQEELLLSRMWLLKRRFSGKSNQN